MGVSSQYVASSASIADGAVSEAKLAAEACSAAKMKKEGTSGQVLTSNGTGAVPSYQALPTTTGDMVMISRQTLGSAADNITFSGFAAGYKHFIIEFNLKANSAMNTLQLILNSDTGANQYPILYQWNTGTSVAYVTEQNAGYNLTNYNGADNSYQSGWVKVGNETYLGQHPISCMSWNTTNNTSVNRFQTSSGFWISTDDITSLVVKTASANGFRTGSTACLYGLK